jgi:hypothetical protein
MERAGVHNVLYTLYLSAPQAMECFSSVFHKINSNQFVVEIFFGFSVICLSDDELT